jgi:hypothetical protein
MANIEWMNSVQFAEFAEVVGIRTELIFATHPESEGCWHILYTPDYDEGDHTMWSARLRRDGEGILRLDTVPQAHPGLWEQAEEGIKAWLENELGPPKGDNDE